MNQVTVTMSAEDARAVAAWRRQQQLTEQYLANLKRINEESKKSEGSLAGMVSKGSSELVKFAVAATGIGSAIAGVMAIANQLKREYENLVARQRGARDAQLGIAEAQREAVMTLGDGSATNEFLASEVSKISRSTGADQAALYEAISASLGSKPDGATDKDVIQAAMVAARSSPTDSAAMKENLMAMMSQKSATGGSWEEIAGYQLRLKRLSPTVSTEAFARNIAPAISKGIDLGTSPDEQSALLAHFGNRMGDKEGMVTANAVTTFEKQIFAATAGKVDGGTIDRLKWLQSEAGAKQRNKFLGPLSDAAKKGKDGEAFGIVGEAKAFTTMLRLINGEDISALETTKSQVGTTAGSDALYRSKMAEIESIPLQRNAKSQLLINAAAQNIQAQDIIAGRGAISRDGLMKLLQTVGASDLTQKIALAKFEATTGFGGSKATESLSESLDSIATEFERPRLESRRIPIISHNGFTGKKYVSGHTNQNYVVPAPAEDKAKASQLRELSMLLREAFRDAMKDVRIEPKVAVVNDAERPKAVPSAKLGRRD